MKDCPDNPSFTLADGLKMGDWFILKEGFAKLARINSKGELIRWRYRRKPGCSWQCIEFEKGETGPFNDLTMRMLDPPRWGWCPSCHQYLYFEVGTIPVIHLNREIKPSLIGIEVFEAWCGHQEPNHHEGNEPVTWVTGKETCSECTRKWEEARSK